MHDIDMTHVETLVYAYPCRHGGMIEMEIEYPKAFRVTPEGAHEIVEFGDVVTTMAPEWLRIEVYPRR